MPASNGRSRRLGVVALDIVNVVKEQVDVEGRVGRSPYGTVAAAIGIGYVLGGGVFSPFTARVLGLGLGLGLRMLIVPIVADQLVELARGVVADDPPAEPASARARSSNGGAGSDAGRI